MYDLITLLPKKCLKIQKGQSQSVSRRTDTQWPKEGQKQRPTKYTHTTKDRVTRSPLKTGSELMYSGRVNSSCSTRGTCRVHLDYWLLWQSYTFIWLTISIFMMPLIFFLQLLYILQNNFLSTIYKCIFNNMHICLQYICNWRCRYVFLMSLYKKKLNSIFFQWKINNYNK